MRVSFTHRKLQLSEIREKIENVPTPDSAELAHTLKSTLQLLDDILYDLDIFYEEMHPHPGV